MRSGSVVSGGRENQQRGGDFPLTLQRKTSGFLKGLFARTLRSDEPACLRRITVPPILTAAPPSWAWGVGPEVAPGLKGFYGSYRGKGEPKRRLLRRMAREQVGQTRH